MALTSTGEQEAVEGRQYFRSRNAGMIKECQGIGFYDEGTAKQR